MYDSSVRSTADGIQHLGSREAQLVQSRHGVGQAREVPQLAQQNLQASTKIQPNTSDEVRAALQALGRCNAMVMSPSTSAYETCIGKASPAALL